MIRKLFSLWRRKDREKADEFIPIRNKDEKVNRFCRQDIIDRAIEILESDHYIPRKNFGTIDENLHKISSADVPSVKTVIKTDPCRFEL